MTAHVPPIVNLEYFYAIFQPAALKLWGSSLVVAIFLKTLQSFIAHPMLVPLFYACVPIIFYIIVQTLQIPLSTLRAQGWLFTFEGGEQVPFYVFWSYYDFNSVNWAAVVSTFPTQLGKMPYLTRALTFFGILHVPINVPALAISTHQEVDLSWEITGHGISNLAAGFLGTPQNYMVYSNSVLYIRCNGNTTISGVLLILVTIALWVKGLFVIQYVPTIVVGSLIFHLGIDLLKESIYDTWAVGLDRLEYLTILIIVAVMGFVGFTEGIVVGVLLACLFFILMYARKSVIRETYTGTQLRSTVHRLYRQQNFLDKVGSQILIIKLQGFMFFGTVNQLDSYIKDMLDRNSPIRFFVLDFTLISGVDYSGLETFLRIKRNLKKCNTHLVFCGVNGSETEIRIGELVDEEGDDPLVHFFHSLNDALEW